MPPEQHGTVSEQLWPASAHMGGTPASMPGGGGGMVHVPLGEPTGTTQVRPVQQSDVAVHTPPSGTHIDPQRSTPDASGTQGAPSQHSAENVHASPVAMQQPGVPS